MTHLVETSRDQAVAIVTLNFAEKRNVLSVELRQALVAALEQLQRDSSCRAIVLTGAGGEFCSGGDISAMRSDDDVGARYRLGLAQQIVRLLIAGRKPTIAAIEGHAIGGGLSLALACDRVVAHRQAKLGAAYSRVGLMPDMALIWTLPQRVGIGKAREIMMLGQTFTATQAATMGLVDVLVDDQSALTVALEEARRYAAAPPLAVALTKATLARATDLESVFAMESDGQALLYQSADHAEARAAFFAKREPQFQGK
jgi:enoyl-CoA hydratase/carnithine racemase